MHTNGIYMTETPQPFTELTFLTITLPARLNFDNKEI